MSDDLNQSMSRDDLAVAQSLLTRVGIDPSTATLHPLPGGRNNRVFRVAVESADEVDGVSCLLKRYFTHPKDPRDRLGADWAFSNLLWQHGMRSLPQPMVADHANHAAMFEWIDGRPFTNADMADDQSHDYVNQALQFLLTVQSLRRTPAAAQINAASEACFSMDEHVTRVARRLQRLAAIDQASNVHRSVIHWTRDVLLPRWDNQLQALANHMRGSAFEPVLPLPMNHRCLSPSDFGYHNALLRGQQLVFLDFEYAGWDDPAKLVCDFFCQPQVPVPIDRFDGIARPLIECLLGNDASVQAMERERLRYHLLLPVYQIKWCCILLNEFLPVGRARREHANPLADAATCMETQFDLVRQLFQRIPATAA